MKMTSAKKKTPNDKPVHLNTQKTVIFMNLSGCPTPYFKGTKQERPQGLALMLQTGQ
jgi:hypothetical protein